MNTGTSSSRFANDQPRPGHPSATETGRSLGRCVLFSSRAAGQGGCRYQAGRQSSLPAPARSPTEKEQAEKLPGPVFQGPDGMGTDAVHLDLSFLGRTTGAIDRLKSAIQLVKEAGIPVARRI